MNGCEKMKKSYKGELILLFTSFIWGFAFVAQSKGMEHIGPFSFNVFRFLLGGITLFIFLLVRRFLTKKEERKPLISKNAWIGGSLIGVVLFIAASFQQYGIMFTSAGKAGFVTSLYMLLVPILSLVIKKKVPWVTWISIIIGLIGLFFLCVKKGEQINKGDMLVLVCAFVFAIHILIVDHFSPKCDGVEMSFVQFIVATSLSLIPMLWRETISFDSVIDAKWSILYAGILSCALAYTTQIIGQKHTNPSVASLIMSLESVFAVLGGMLLLDEFLKIREWIGCILILGAVILSQIKSINKQMD